MIRFQDGMLLAVTFSSIIIGIVFPETCSIFSGLPKYCMMALLFLSFLSIKLTDLFRSLKGRFSEILIFLFLKLIVLPVGVFFVFRSVAPQFALAALLLSGISTGVVAPFFADILDTDVSRVILVVVTSSILVPFTLPVLVEFLVGSQMDISLGAMIQLLSLVIFIPVVSVEALRRIQPLWIEKLLQVKQPVSLVLFAVTNMGVFSSYAAYFRSQVSVVAIACGVAIILAIFYFFIGLAISWRKSVQDKIATIIMFGIMNNILVIVFSAEFFSPLEPTVAAAYCIPFFSFILPLRILKTVSKNSQ